MADNKSKSLPVPVMVRLPTTIAAQVREMAATESESQSHVLRRLIRAGLAEERRLAAAVGASAR